MQDDEQTILDAIGRQGSGIRVSFVWRRDRYAHTIYAIEGQRLAPLLASQEGGQQDDWPPSPPLQQLTIERRPQGKSVALLIGMAGRSYWSMSVEADPKPPQIMLDVACRINQHPRRLGGRYRLLAELQNMDGRAGVLCGTSRHCQLRVERDPAVAARLEVTDSVLIITPNSGPVSPPYTIRWRYRIELL